LNKYEIPACFIIPETCKKQGLDALLFERIKKFLEQGRIQAA